MKVCFIGHRTIEKTENLVGLLREVIISLINRGAKTFLFGSKSAFDDLSWQIVSELRETYPFINRTYVRSAYQYISKSYEEYLLESFEETYFPLKLERAGRCSYVERNYEMINSSDTCVFYYNESYVPVLKGNRAVEDSRKSGTKIAYEYAKKKKKEIINLFR